MDTMTKPPAEAPETPRKKWYLRKRVIVPAAIVALGIGGIATGAGQQDTISPEPEVKQSETAIPEDKPVEQPKADEPTPVLPPAPEPEPEPEVQASDFDLSPSMDRAYVDAVADRVPEALYMDGQGLIDMAKDACVSLAEGQSWEDIAVAVTSTSANPADANALMDITQFGAGYYCPELANR